MDLFFTKLVGTVAVMLVVASLISGSELLTKFLGTDRNWKYSLIAGLIGGVLGIYGNLSGVEWNGAIVSVRDIGPMLAGLIGGPFGGLLGGAIAGAHRFSMGGITATACVVATCCIGVFCGLIAKRQLDKLIRPWAAFLVGASMEAFHLCVVLLLVRPFETAWLIVRTIAVPFILVNAVGFMLMIAIMNYIEGRRSLAVERNRLQSELEAASMIQHSLLPPITEAYPGRAEFTVCASMEAAKEVGGDFYDFFPIGSDAFGFLIADVSGKGIPAALFMANAKQILQNCVRDIPDLSEAIRRANESLCSQNEAELFVTAWVGVLNIPTGRLRFVCAGHNPPVLVSKGKTEYIRARGGFVLAGMEGAPYRESELEMHAGDAILLYTDGVTEAEDAEKKQYGEERLLECLSSMENANAEEIIARVRADVASHVKGVAQSDDLTMLCLQMN